MEVEFERYREEYFEKVEERRRSSVENNEELLRQYPGELARLRRWAWSWGPRGSLGGSNYWRSWWLGENPRVEGDSGRVPDTLWMHAMFPRMPVIDTVISEEDEEDEEEEEEEVQVVSERRAGKRESEDLVGVEEDGGEEEDEGDVWEQLGDASTGVEERSRAGWRRRSRRRREPSGRSLEALGDGDRAMQAILEIAMAKSRQQYQQQNRRRRATSLGVTILLSSAPKSEVDRGRTGQVERCVVPRQLGWMPRPQVMDSIVPLAHSQAGKEQPFLRYVPYFDAEQDINHLRRPFVWNVRPDTVAAGQRKMWAWANAYAIMSMLLARGGLTVSALEAVSRTLKLRGGSSELRALLTPLVDKGQAWQMPRGICVGEQGPENVERRRMWDLHETQPTSIAFAATTRALVHGPSLAVTVPDALQVPVVSSILPDAEALVPRPSVSPSALSPSTSSSSAAPAVVSTPQPVSDGPPEPDAMIMAPFRGQFCRICVRYACRLHGGSARSDPEMDGPVIRQLLVPAALARERVIRRAMEERWTSDDLQPGKAADPNQAPPPTASPSPPDQKTSASSASPSPTPSSSSQNLPLPKGREPEQDQVLAGCGPACFLHTHGIIQGAAVSMDVTGRWRVQLAGSKRVLDAEAGVKRRRKEDSSELEDDSESREEEDGDVWLASSRSLPAALPSSHSSAPSVSPPDPHLLSDLHPHPAQQALHGVNASFAMDDNDLVRFVDSCAIAYDGSTDSTATYAGALIAARTFGPNDAHAAARSRAASAGRTSASVAAQLPPLVAPLGAAPAGNYATRMTMAQFWTQVARRGVQASSEADREQQPTQTQTSAPAPRSTSTSSSSSPSSVSSSGAAAPQNTTFSGAAAASQNTTFSGGDAAPQNTTFFGGDTSSLQSEGTMALLGRLHVALDGRVCDIARALGRPCAEVGTWLQRAGLSCRPARGPFREELLSRLLGVDWRKRVGEHAAKVARDAFQGKSRSARPSSPARWTRKVHDDHTAAADVDDAAGPPLVSRPSRLRADLAAAMACTVAIRDPVVDAVVAPPPHTTHPLTMASVMGLGMDAAAGYRRQAKRARALLTPKRGPRRTTWERRCLHVGPCDAECPCVIAQRMCSKHCGCAFDCENRWYGCKCSGQCRGKQCPCRARFHECDPDLCLCTCATSLDISHAWPPGDYERQAAIEAGEPFEEEEEDEYGFEGVSAHVGKSFGSSSFEGVSANDGKSSGSSFEGVSAKDAKSSGSSFEGVSAKDAKSATAAKSSSSNSPKKSSNPPSKSSSSEPEDLDWRKLAEWDVTAAQTAAELAVESAAAAGLDSLTEQRASAAEWIAGLAGATLWRVDENPRSRRIKRRAALSKVCGNAELQTTVRKRLFIGPSTIPAAGLGLFAGEFIDRGELVQEYHGEIISQLESERRGAVADTRRRTYLFDLGNDFSIDAMRKGNKIRYSNHKSDREKPNCESRRVVIGGVPCIGVYATRPLRPGDEIFYNYDRDTQRARDVVEKESKKKKKK